MIPAEFKLFVSGGWFRNILKINTFFKTEKKVDTFRSIDQIGL